MKKMSYSSAMKMKIQIKIAKNIGERKDKNTEIIWGWNKGWGVGGSGDPLIFFSFPTL